jgi:glycosyltransferase involved in cell wall biosynthesis
MAAGAGFPASQSADAAPRTILVVAYFFPPLGGGGVQRTVKFLKYLRPLGWRSEVITVRAAKYWSLDPALAAEVPADTQVHRTFALTGPDLLPRGKAGAQGLRSTAFFRRLRRWSSFFLVPDAYVGWFPFALARARERIERGGVEVVFTTSSPDSAHLVGLVLRERMPIQWVADFRDPWVRRLTFHAPTAWHRRLHLGLERRVLERADRVLVTNKATRDDFLFRHPHVPVERFAVIPNGYDPEDVAVMRQGSREAASPAAQSGEAPRGSELVLVHTGLLSGRRTLAPVVDAMARLFAARPELASRLRLRQVGPRESVNDELVALGGLGGNVTFAPPVGHVEVLAEMAGAGALLLLEAGEPEGSLITPGKLFEYLASRRPILAVVPPGPAADLVRATRAGEVVAPHDAAGLAAVLERWLVDGPPASQVQDQDLAAYARPALAARLAALLDELAPPPRGLAARSSAATPSPPA